MATFATDTVDGSMLEGGGQLTRAACALAVGLGRDVTVNNIRAGRSTPGLRPQHVASAKLTAAVGGLAMTPTVGDVALVVRGSASTDAGRDVFEADAGTAGRAELSLSDASRRRHRG